MDTSTPIQVFRANWKELYIDHKYLSIICVVTGIVALFFAANKSDAYMFFVIPAFFILLDVLFSFLFGSIRRVDVFQDRIVFKSRFLFVFSFKRVVRYTEMYAVKSFSDRGHRDYSRIEGFEVIFTNGNSKRYYLNWFHLDRIKEMVQLVKPKLAIPTVVIKDYFE